MKSNSMPFLKKGKKKILQSEKGAFQPGLSHLLVLYMDFQPQLVLTAYKIENRKSTRINSA